MVLGDQIKDISLSDKGGGEDRLSWMTKISHSCLVGLKSVDCKGGSI